MPACENRAAYLRANGPWGQLVRLENIALRECQPGQPFGLEENISIKPIAYEPDGAARKAIEGWGFRVAGEGEEVGL